MERKFEEGDKFEKMDVFWVFLKLVEKFDEMKVFILKFVVELLMKVVFFKNRWMCFRVVRMLVVIVLKVFYGDEIVG